MICSHKVLFVDSFNEEGALVSCLDCDNLSNLTGDQIEEYYPFVYVSPQGKDYDMVVLVLTSLLERKEP